MNQFDLNLQSFINDVPIVVADTLMEIGLDGKALIQQRVQEKGLNANGGKTPDYSPLYAEKRKKLGRQTSFMDLTMTGEMWRSIGFTEKQVDGAQTKITIAGRDKFTQDKINWNSEKQFEVLKLAKDEEEILATEFDEIFTAKIISYLERGIQ